MENIDSDSLMYSLNCIRRRVYWLAILLGLGLVCTLFVLLLFLVVALDYFVNLHAVPRLMLELAAAGAIGYGVWHWVVMAIASRLSINDIAGRLERTFPQFQDRLASTINFLSGKENSASQIMQSRVVSEAVRLAQGIDLTRVLVTRPVWFADGAGTIALLLLVLVISTFNHSFVRIARDRLLTPFAAAPWPKQVGIDLVNAPTRAVAVGDQIEVQVRLSRGDSAHRKAVIHFQYFDDKGGSVGSVQQEYMTRGDDGVYRASIDARTASEAAAGTVQMWVESGDGELTVNPIKIVPRLKIIEVEALVTAPSYAKLPRQRINLMQNPAVITAGSKVTLAVTFNKVLDAKQQVKVELLTPDGSPAFTWEGAKGNSRTADVQTARSFRFRLHAEDTDGLSNTATEQFEIVVRPDQSPSVTIETPVGNEDHTPTAVVPVSILAEDDFGIEILNLEVDRPSDQRHWKIVLVDQTRATPGTTWDRVDAAGELVHFQAGYSWDLAALERAKLQPGDVLEYYARVKDNYNLNGETHPEAASSKLRITIISQEAFSNKVVDELNTVAEQLTSLKSTQVQTLKETATLAQEMAAKPAMDEADKVAADRIAERQSSIAAQAKSLANTLHQLQTRMAANKSDKQELKDTAKEVQALLDSAAETSMKNAASNLSEAQQAVPKAASDQSMVTAQANQSRANDDLQAAMDRMGNIGGLSRTIESVSSLLAEQQQISSETAAAGKMNLGKSLAELTPGQRAQLNSLAKAQAELSAKTQKALDEMSRNASKLAKSDPDAAKAITQAATTASHQDVTGQQSQAAEATQENQQSQAESAQQGAEQGLQMMLDDLDHAKKAKLDKLAKKLEDLQQQLAVLIHQQANHNLDNLGLQGGDALARLDPVERQQLLEDAQPGPTTTEPLVDLPMLITAQAQTVETTLAISKPGDDSQDSGESLDHLTKAADKMGRAIVELKQGNLVTGYNPAQTDALNELREARRAVDQQKKAVDDQQEQEQKATIKTAYEGLLKQQTDLNGRVVAIDASHRNADGSMRRTDIARRSMLVGVQKKIAEDTAALDEPLANLNSIVYRWANQEIVKNMNQARDLLDKGETGLKTQSEQEQIVYEINTILRDLLTKPKPPEATTQPDKGGGGGSGSMPQPPPEMPSEAEFRLIKDLQLSINNATAVLAGQSQPSKSVLMEIGNRESALRELLDKLIHKATKGKSGLRPESDQSQTLPEESDSSKLVPLQVTENPSPDVKADLNLIGRRMTRVRQRLVDDGDPGIVTRQIEDRIIQNLETLVQLSRQKKPKPKDNASKPTTRPSEKKKPPQPMQAGAQPENSGAPGAKPADGAAAAQGAKNVASNDADKVNQAPRQPAMWGNVSPRERDAVIESQGEKVLDRYKSLVDDYYQTMSRTENGK